MSTAVAGLYLFLCFVFIVIESVVALVHMPWLKPLGC
jgi:hypothetical protein